MELPNILKSRPAWQYGVIAIGGIGLAWYMRKAFSGSTGGSSEPEYLIAEAPRTTPGAIPTPVLTYIGGEVPAPSTKPENTGVPNKPENLNKPLPVTPVTPVTSVQPAPSTPVIPQPVAKPTAPTTSSELPPVYSTDGWHAPGVRKFNIGQYPGVPFDWDQISPQADRSLFIDWRQVTFGSNQGIPRQRNRIGWALSGNGLFLGRGIDPQGGRAALNNMRRRKGLYPLTNAEMDQVVREIQKYGSTSDMYNNPPDALVASLTARWNVPFRNPPAREVLASEYHRTQEKGTNVSGYYNG